MSETARPSEEPTPVRSSTTGASQTISPRGVWRWVVRHLAVGFSHLTHLWRVSLQFRVVTTTVVLGVIVVTLLATYLFKEIANGLQSDRVASAEAESRELTNTAQQLFDDTVKTSSEADLNSVAWDTVNGQLAAPNSEDSRYVIFTRSIANDSTTVLDTVASDGIRFDIIPKEMRTAVAQDPGHQQTTLVPFTIPPDPTAPEGRDPAIPAGEVVPAVVVGSQVQVPVAGSYDLYFIYPMDREQATLNLLTRSFTVGGMVLILLVGGVAYLVTRQVVTPVRRAASVAIRLSDGNLNERMSARGEDDLAMLGKSFNEMADNLQAQIRQLEGLSRVQQRFVSDVSHELRTPLTTIRMAAEVIHDARSEFPTSLARSAELLHTEVDRFEDLLGDLLEISRFDAGAAALDGGPSDLVEIAESVVQAASAVAARGGSTVSITAPDEPCVAELDVRRVERIVRNLVVNAIEHGEGRPVEVVVGQNENAVAVLVQDHGVGLRPGESSLVFNRFWRADPARTRTTGGTGLGLAISLEDARLHHGWLQAWGEPGRGSRFRLTLPKEQSVPIDTSPVPLAPSDMRGHAEDGTRGPREGEENRHPTPRGDVTHAADAMGTHFREASP